MPAQPNEPGQPNKPAQPDDPEQPTVPLARPRGAADGASAQTTARPTAAPPSAHLLPHDPFAGGDRVLDGRYRMVKKLGAGGMGAVFLVDDLLLRRRVALKMLFAHRMRTAEDIARFRKEAAIAHSVHDPHVARTYDIGEEGGVHYLSMEHLRGETLLARLKREMPLSSEQTRAIAVPMCLGLRAAHRAGIVHRDLKPANIMLTDDERGAVVMDFGVARSLHDRADLAAAPIEGDQPWDVTSAGRGTPAYMAPEQWDGLSGDTRTDIYALGVMLYVCLTGKAPFSARSLDELADKHRLDPPPRLSSVVDGVDPTLERLVLRCLEKDPAARPASMDEVLEVLRAPERRRRWLRQTAVVAASSLLVLGLSGLAVWEVAKAAVVHEMRPALGRLAELVARDVPTEGLDAIRDASAIGTPAFDAVDAVLRRYREDNEEIRYVYTMRSGDGPHELRFVVDEDWREEDEDGDGVISPDEEQVVPGQAYDASRVPAMVRAVREGVTTVDRAFTVDRWGVTLSGYAPVRDPAGRFTGVIVGVDASNAQLHRLRHALIAILGLVWAGTLLVFAGAPWLSTLRRRRARGSPAAHQGSSGRSA